MDQKAEKYREASELQKKIAADNKQIQEDPVQFLKNKNRGRVLTSFKRVTEQKKLGLGRKQINYLALQKCRLKKQSMII